MKPSSVGENFASVLELCSTCEDFIVCMSILLNLCMRVRVAFLITILPGQWAIRPTLRFSHEETFFNVHTGPPSLWPLSEKVKCSIHFSRIGGGGAIVPGLFHSTSPSTLNSIDVSFQSTLQYIFHLLKKKTPKTWREPGLLAWKSSSYIWVIRNPHPICAKWL